MWAASGGKMPPIGCLASEEGCWAIETFRFRFGHRHVFAFNIERDFVERVHGLGVRHSAGNAIFGCHIAVAAPLFQNRFHFRVVLDATIRVLSAQLVETSDCDAKGCIGRHHSRLVGPTR